MTKGALLANNSFLQHKPDMHINRLSIESESLVNDFSLLVTLLALDYIVQPQFTFTNN